MKKGKLIPILFFQFILACILTTNAQSEVIFNNFGKGDTYATNFSYGIGKSPWGGADIDQGDAFTFTGSNITLDTISVAVSLFDISVGNKFDLLLMNDINGHPGNVIEIFNFNNITTTPTIITGYSVLHPLLNANTQYWLIGDTPTADTTVGWYLSWDNGLHAGREDMGKWIVSDGPQGAFRITGTPVVPTPIPTMNEWGMIIFMALAGVGSLYHLRRKKIKDKSIFHNILSGKQTKQTGS